MAHQQHGIAEALQVFDQPDLSLEIEVVGGLIEDQQIGIAEQRAGQCYAHAPAAGIFAAGTSLGGCVEAQAIQDRGRTRRCRRGADLLQPRMDLGQAKAVMAFGVLGQKRATLEVGREDRVEHRDVAARRILRHGADPGAPHDVDGAGVGLDLPLDQAEQRGFARAVATHEADFPAVRKGPGSAIEQHALAMAKR